MIRFKLKQLLEEKSFRERRRITLGEVSATTGVSRATLTRMSNIAGYNTNTAAIDALCEFFQCQPGQLLEYVSNPPDGPGR